MIPTLLLCLPLMTTPATSFEVEDGWNEAAQEAVQYLLKAQEGIVEETVIGEWPYEGVYRERGQIPPGYRVGGTAIVLRALIETLPTKKIRLDAADPINVALRRGLNFLLAESCKGLNPKTIPTRQRRVQDRIHQCLMEE